MTENKQHNPKDPANDTERAAEEGRRSPRPDGAAAQDRPEPGETTDPANDPAEATDPPAGDSRAGDAGTGDAGTGDAGTGDPGTGDAGAEETSEAEDPAARIAALEDELSRLKDNAMRAMAEAENVRKRAERQVADANKYGAVGLAREMLTISDNLRRALEAAPADTATDNEALANLRTGVEMTEKELQSALQRHHVTEITPQPGDRFDPNLHQAMVEIPTDEHPPGTVAQVMQAGYQLHDRLLRAAMVGVAKAPPPPQDDAEKPDGEGGPDGNAAA